MSLSPDQIEVKKSTEQPQIVYNIGDLLNMPTFFSATFQHDEARALRTAAAFPGSVLANYYGSRPVGEPVPSVRRIREAVAKFGGAIAHPLLTQVQDPTTLVVHLRSGDRGKVGDAFTKKVIELGAKFEKVLLFTGVHGETRLGSINQNKANTCASVNTILSKLPKATVCLEDPDIHLALMSKAKNLLVHRGGFSVLGSLLCDGTVYVTKELPSYSNAKWREAVKGKKVVFS
jgi:hypothetical protein